jgi:hypothetical protein
VGKFFTNIGLDFAKGSLDGVDHVAGQTDTALAIQEFGLLVQRE